MKRATRSCPGGSATGTFDCIRARALLRAFVKHARRRGHLTERHAHVLIRTLGLDERAPEGAMILAQRLGTTPSRIHHLMDQAEGRLVDLTARPRVRWSCQHPSPDRCRCAVRL